MRYMRVVGTYIFTYLHGYVSEAAHPIHESQLGRHVGYSTVNENDNG